MKHLIIALAVMFSVTTAPAQPFEGVIKYSNTLKSKNPKMTDEQWTDMMGSVQEYYIKLGNYKSMTNGTMAEWQMYLNKDNKVYTKMKGSEEILWNNAAVNTDAVLKTELKKNAATILGYECDELTLTCKSGVQKYYFSSKLPVDVKLYENHKYGNWHDYLKNAKAINLKTVIETPQFTMETVATEVRAMKLTDDFFILTPGAELKRNPYVPGE